MGMARHPLAPQSPPLKATASGCKIFQLRARRSWETEILVGLRSGGCLETKGLYEHMLYEQGVVQREIRSCKSGAALWQGPGKWVSLSLEISRHQLDGALNDLL